MTPEELQKAYDGGSKPLFTQEEAATAIRIVIEAYLYGAPCKAELHDYLRELQDRIKPVLRQMVEDGAIHSCEGRRLQTRAEIDKYVDDAWYHFRFCEPNEDEEDD